MKNHIVKYRVKLKLNKVSTEMDYMIENALKYVKPQILRYFENDELFSKHLDLINKKVSLVLAKKSISNLQYMENPSLTVCKAALGKYSSKYTPSKYKPSLSYIPKKYHNKLIS